ALKQFVEQCLQKTTHDAVFLVSLQGGYYHTPAPYVEFAWFSIPYYFDQQMLSIPSKSEVEEQMALYIEDKLLDCASGFQHPSLSIRFGDPSVTVNLQPESVESNAKVSVYIRKGDQEIELTSFRTQVPAELGLALDMRDILLELQQETPNEMPMSKYTRLLRDKNIFLDARHFENTVLYNIIYPHSSFNSEDYVFTYAVKYDWSDDELPQI
ncbi:MAG: hypothetical protein AABX37_02230, partial [Nanoarchaeota archaeon]